MKRFLTTSEVSSMANAYRGYRYPNVTAKDVALFCRNGDIKAKKSKRCWLVVHRSAKKFIRRYQAQCEHADRQESERLISSVSSIVPRGYHDPIRRAFIAAGGDEHWYCEYLNGRLYFPGSPKVVLASPDEYTMSHQQRVYLLAQLDILNSVHEVFKQGNIIRQVTRRYDPEAHRWLSEVTYDQNATTSHCKHSREIENLTGGD